MNGMSNAILAVGLEETCSITFSWICATNLKKEWTKGDVISKHNIKSCITCYFTIAPTWHKWLIGFVILRVMLAHLAYDWICFGSFVECDAAVCRMTTNCAFRFLVLFFLRMWVWTIWRKLCTWNTHQHCCTVMWVAWISLGLYTKVVQICLSCGSSKQCKSNERHGAQLEKHHRRKQLYPKSSSQSVKNNTNNCTQRNVTCVLEKLDRK